MKNTGNDQSTITRTLTQEEIQATEKKEELVNDYVNSNQSKIDSNEFSILGGYTH